MMEGITLNKTKNNIVQVYGLQKSGTNFIEWTLRNNFPDLEYDGLLWGLGEVPGDEKYRQIQSLKHLLPKRDKGKALIIRRNFDDWYYSIKKHFPNCYYNRHVYDFYYDTPYREDWHTDEYMIIDHSWAVQNYEALLERIRILSGGVAPIENWKQPLKRLKTDGGKTLSKEGYKL